MPDLTPTHAGRLAFVPVWAWTVTEDADLGPCLQTRWFLPWALLEFAAWLQVAACDVIGLEPAFRIDLQPVTPWQARAWRFERWLVGLFT